MTAPYKLTGAGGGVLLNGGYIPPDPGLKQWQDYQAWLAAGGMPAPADSIRTPPNWLSTYQSYFNGGDPSKTTTLVVAAGPEAILGAAQTAPGTRRGANAIGMQGYGVANNVTLGSDFAWGYYGEGHACVPTSMAWGAELCVVNRTGALHPLSPYHSERGNTICLQLDSGCGFTGAAMGDPVPQGASAAVAIVQNYGGDVDKPFGAGIVFLNGSVGGGHAIEMPVGYNIEWFPPNSQAPTAAVGSSATGAQLYSQGVAAIEAHAPATGETGLLLAVNRAGTTVLSQVKLGAPNSGGTGLRALVVDN